MSIITDYESLTNLKTVRGRAVKIKNPIAVSAARGLRVWAMWMPAHLAYRCAALL